MHPTRRQFALAIAALTTTRAWAIDPIKREGKAKLTPSLAAYSFNRQLNLKAKPKPEMALEDFIDLGAQLELPAVELTAYYFPKTTEEYLKSIKKRCNDHKLAISGTAVGNDFCWADEKKAAEQMDYVKQWIEHSAVLGAKTLRIFAGSVKKPDTEDDARKRTIEAIHKACEIAAKHKVVLALENHGGITATADQLLAIVKAVKSDWFGVNLDTGNFRTADPYADMEKAVPYSVVVQLKTEVNAGGKVQEADLGRIIKMLRTANFQGYVALEYEAKEDPKTAVPKHVKELKKLTE